MRNLHELERFCGPTTAHPMFFVGVERYIRYSAVFENMSEFRRAALTVAGIERVESRLLFNTYLTLIPLFVFGTLYFVLHQYWFFLPVVLTVLNLVICLIRMPKLERAAKQCHKYSLLELQQRLS